MLLKVLLIIIIGVKLIEKLIKSNAKIESLINENHHLAKINRKANKSDGNEQ